MRSLPYHLTNYHGFFIPEMIVYELSGDSIAESYRGLERILKANCLFQVYRDSDAEFGSRQKRHWTLFIADSNIL